MFVCFLCNEIFALSKLLCNHLANHHDLSIIYNFPCHQEICDRIFSSLRALVKHVKKKSQINSNTTVNFLENISVHLIHSCDIFVSSEYFSDECPSKLGSRENESILIKDLIDQSELNFVLELFQKYNLTRANQMLI